MGLLYRRGDIMKGSEDRIRRRTHTKLVRMAQSQMEYNMELEKQTNMGFCNSVLTLEKGSTICEKVYPLDMKPRLKVLLHKTIKRLGDSRPIRVYRFDWGFIAMANDELKSYSVGYLKNRISKSFIKRIVQNVKGMLTSICVYSTNCIIKHPFIRRYSYGSTKEKKVYTQRGVNFLAKDFKKEEVEKICNKSKAFVHTKI